MYKANTGGPIELWTEHTRAFGALFGVGTSDDFATTLWDGSPARVGHQHEQTSYATVPSEQHQWINRLHGTLSPAKAPTALHKRYGGQTT